MKLSRGVFIGSIVVLSIIVIGSLAITCEKKFADDALAKTYAFAALSGEGSFLGVHLGEVDQEVVKRLGLKEEYGALVKKVVEESAAEKAGLKEDDVIISWNNGRIESAAQLRRIVKETPPGRKTSIGIMRDGSALTVEAALEKRKSPALDFAMEEPLRIYAEELGKHSEELGKKTEELNDKIKKLIIKDKDGEIIVNGMKLDDLGAGIAKDFLLFSGKPRMGVMLQDLTPQLGEYFGLKDDRGVLITSIIEDSPAEKAGMKAGDVIVSIDGKDIEDSGDVIGAVAEKKEGTLDVVVIRDKQERSFKVTIEKKEDLFEKKIDPIKREIRIKAPHVSKSTEI